jgi:hypothetical protein
MSGDTTSNASQEAELELFYGSLNPAVGRVYARWGSAERAGISLRGTLTGPTCEYANTLPATSRFVDRGPGGPPLAEAIVPEPSFWTPEMPHLYRAELELLDGGQVVAKAERTFGFRPLGAAGNRFRLDGKNWVLRGVDIDEEQVGELAKWRESSTAIVVKRPSDLLCEAASRLGVLIVAELDEFDLVEIRRLSRWPAVGMVVLPAGCDFEARAVAHNMLLAERIGGAQPSPWADALICEVAAGHAWSLPTTSLPVIAERRQGATAVRDGRAACDRLQAELAPAGLLAGYIC